MEQPPGSVIDPAVVPAEDAQLDEGWEEAYAMVEGYYSALRVRNRLLRAGGVAERSMQRV